MACMLTRPERLVPVMSTAHPDDHLRCRSGRRVWLDDTARARCCDPAWQKVLVYSSEWPAEGIEYARRSAGAGLAYGWQRTARPSQPSEIGP